MLIKLTHKGTPTLINYEQIVSIYQDTDMKSGTIGTKITTTNGIVFVEEGLNQIQKLVWQVKNGQAPDMDYEVPTIENRMEKSFNQERPLSYAQSHRQRQPMRRPYSPHSFNNDYNY